MAEPAKLPWLERQRQALERLQVVKLFRETSIPTADEIIRYVGERYRRLRPPRVKGDRLARRKVYELKRLELVYNIVTSKLGSILTLPPTRRMNEFHKLLIQMFVGEEYDRALAKLRKARRLANEFWQQYRLLILSAETVEEAARYRKEGAGRILSLIRRSRKELELLRKVREEIVKTHVVSEGLPVVVVAGIPSAGKSTLVKRISTAEPEVAEYPFTTKTVIVGKARYKDTVFYIVDTPGIMDRPVEEMNPIEKKALAALMALPDLIIFLFDPSPDSYQDIDKQLKLYNTIKRIAGEKNIHVLPVANKIDKPSNTPLKRLKSELGDTLVEISALHGTGIETLLEEIRKHIRQRI